MIDPLTIQNAVEYLKSVSERYAPNVENFSAQCAKVSQEVEELRSEVTYAFIVGERKEEAATECADVIIAAVRLGTMLSEDFAQVILDKCKELNEREPLK